MAAINFFADDNGIQNLNGSGLGFYGTNFGNSVEVGAFQGTTFITDGNGVIQGPQVNNTTWTHPASGAVNGASSIPLVNIANRLASLNIRFTHSSNVRTQNAKLRIFDRSNINNPASGVTTKVAELIHPNPTNGPGGSGNSLWQTPTGSSSIMDLTPSPGQSGYSPNGATTIDQRHDHYIICSASPDSIGAKTLYALYMELEFL